MPHCSEASRHFFTSRNAKEQGQDLEANTQVQEDEEPCPPLEVEEQVNHKGDKEEDEASHSDWRVGLVAIRPCFVAYKGVSAWPKRALSMWRPLTNCVAGHPAVNFCVKAT